MELQEDEFALSKDTTVALWKDYMSFYGDVQLQEILGREVQLVGKTYLLISSAHLDTFCEWMYRKRSMCTSQENAVPLLWGGNGQHTILISPPSPKP